MDKSGPRSKIETVSSMMVDKDEVSFRHESSNKVYETNYELATNATAIIVGKKEDTESALPTVIVSLILLALLVNIVAITTYYIYKMCKRRKEKKLREEMVVVDGTNPDFEDHIVQSEALLSGGYNTTDNESMTSDPNIRRNPPKRTNSRSMSAPSLFRKVSRQASLEAKYFDLGQLDFAVQHKVEEKQLEVYLIKAERLTPRTSKELRDPYVIVKLLPDIGRRKQSKIILDDLHPDFDEMFTFDIDGEDIRTLTLKFHVMDAGGKRKRRQEIGHVTFPLAGNDWSVQQEFWMNIVKMDPRIKVKASEVDVLEADRGEMLLSLTHKPNSRVLTVVVEEVNNVDPERDLSDPVFMPGRKKKHQASSKAALFVKIRMTEGSRKVKSVKTSQKVGTTNPKFKETFTFDVSKCDLAEVGLKVMVKKKELFLQDTLGRLVIGYPCGALTEHLHSPDSPEPTWYRLE
ncbi:synaptotagmin-5-like [Branchiostoma floridae]|uniref:Synaptotagmin-5-like n=2 Tax=Branchiostoma floridae TaxID=7739 RepID=A0A9J7KX58_BRAFL|nr:synaptotagmin-5-like [Branchiostoma floridae]